MSTAETGSKGRGVPYVAAAGLALALWVWAAVWAARRGLLPVRRQTGAEDGDGAALTPARIDVNSAGEAALEALPGIGLALSRRIVEERKARGPFRGPEDLMRVRGFTRELVERIEPFVKFGGPARLLPQRAQSTPSFTCSLPPKTGMPSVFSVYSRRRRSGYGAQAAVAKARRRPKVRLLQRFGLP